MGTAMNILTQKMANPILPSQHSTNALANIAARQAAQGQGTQNILQREKLGTYKRRNTPEMELMIRKATALNQAILTGDKTKANMVYKSYGFKEVPDFEFLDNKEMTANVDGIIYKGNRDSLAELSEGMASNPEYFGEWGNSPALRDWMLRKGISVAQAEQAKPVKGIIKTISKAGEDRQVLVDPYTGKEIKDLGLAPKKQPGVAVNVGGQEGEFQKQQAKSYSDLLKEARDNYSVAMEDNSNIEMMNRLYEKGLETGLWDKFTSGVSKFLGTKQGSMADTMDFLMLKNIGKYASWFKPMSNDEVKLIKTSIANLGNREEANKLIMAMGKAGNDYNIKKYKITQNLKKSKIPWQEQEEALNVWESSQPSAFENIQKIAKDFGVDLGAGTDKGTVQTSPLTVVQTGTIKGRKVEIMSDGSRRYAE